AVGLILVDDVDAGVRVGGRAGQHDLGLLVVELVFLRIGLHVTRERRWRRSSGRARGRAEVRRRVVGRFLAATAGEKPDRRERERREAPREELRGYRLAAHEPSLALFQATGYRLQASGARQVCSRNLKPKRQRSVI